MNALVSFEKISLAFGLDVLLDKAQLQINHGERICLIGRNGAGKSSLLKIIDGQMMPDSGTVWQKPNLRLGVLAQDLPQKSSATVYEYVAQGFSQTGLWLSEYHAIVQRLAHNADARDLARLEKLQQLIDTHQGWQLSQTIATTLTRLQLNPDRQLNELSGGWQRRAALAKALVASPELLLLDEPTNHLDIEAIRWLEEQLLTANISLLFITHDRSLLQHLATRIIELDRGHLTSWPGDYNNFLRRKEELLHAEAQQHAEFDKKLAQEERWIRQGIKARRTRNEGRVRALKALRIERAKRRELQGKASFSLNQEERSGHLVIEAKQITHGFGDQLLIKDFSMRIMRGDRIGLIGANGMGKSTLLAILLGQLAPAQGQVILGTHLKIAYFDQLRSVLDVQKTAIDNLSLGSDEVEVNGKKQHVISYLRDFLFTPERARTPVKALSGGERSRLLLARLFTQPANLLVLDEPTNDLDIETLELLEELLNSYTGTLLLVSHDRAFLNNVVTSTLVFEGHGKVAEYIGGYDDWLRQAKATAVIPATSAAPKIAKPISSQTQLSQASSTLTYDERKELGRLPQKIEKLETRLQELQATIAAADFYQQDAKITNQTLAQLKEVEQNLELVYERWQALENKKQ